jgi:energy-coupling factor transport system ATP-binding protein
VACGLLRPSHGQVRLGGRLLESIPPAERGRLVGFVFQNPDHQIFAPTVREEVSFAPRNFGLSPGEVDRAVREALSTVGLEGAEDLDPFVMTRGDRQRVAVASVLATGPSVIVMDEPTTGLDHADQQRMMALLRQLQRRGRTVIVVTHAIGLATAWAGRIVVLHRGELVTDGPTVEVMASSSLPRDSAIRPPRIVELAVRLGVRTVSVDDLADCLGRPGEGGRA